jgi:hypothetical protein
MKRSMIVVTLLACVSSVAGAQRVGYVAINGVRIAKCERMLAAVDAGQHSMLEPLRDEIENIEVVKGLAAAKLYGPDATDGAILITLKKGATVPPTLCGAAKEDDPIFIVDGQPVAPSAPVGQPPVDPIARRLFAPEFVTAHQDAIGLTTVQRTTIQALVKTAELKVVDVQFRLTAASEKLAKTLAAPVVDEAAVLEQIDQVLAMERDVKRAQITLLVRVKNQLSAAQQEKLDKLR